MRAVEPPDITFSIEATVLPQDCLVCTYGIDPNESPTHMKIHLDYPQTLHMECFEKLGWSMTYFVLNYKPPEEELSRSN